MFVSHLRVLTKRKAVIRFFSSSSLNRRLCASTSSRVFSDTDITADGDSVYAESPVSSTVNPVVFNVLQPRVVVYDGVCHLCHGGVKWVIEADKYRKIKFCCLQSDAAKPYLKASGLEREDVLRRFLFVEGHGSYHQASTAALRVMSYLPLPYSALSTLSVVPTPLRDAVYDYVAKHRYKWFGKAEGCLVLREKELLERFIDRDEILDKEEDQSI